jgi:hypothetical protein
VIGITVATVVVRCSGRPAANSVLRNRWLPSWRIMPREHDNLRNAFLSITAVASLTVAWLPRAVEADRSFDAKSCTFNGKKLYGKIQIVDDWPDLKVQVVDDWPDLKVQKVKEWPDACGKWQFVKQWPDLKIKFVKQWPDLKIKFVKEWPGA